VTPRANLVSHHRDTLLAASYQPIVMGEDRRGNPGTQLGPRGFGIGIFAFVEIEDLKFKEAGDVIAHGWY
jgi:hypothetical protein